MSVTLRELYLAELNDLYDAEQQVLRELPLLSAGASSVELRDAFDVHYRQTQQHITRLEALFRYLDERPRLVSSRALRTIIEDSRLRYAQVDRGAVRDAALIAAAQRIEHYEIAAYRCARTYAVSIADLNGADILNETLEEEGGMDQRLVELAMAGGLTTTGHLDPSTWLRAPRA
jgi:ferritin-like metal-binding protein YciE